jgi:hypothetical protein
VFHSQPADGSLARHKGDRICGLFVLEDAMKTIELTQEQVALVDDEDEERVRKYTWCAQKTKSGRFYAVTWLPWDTNGKRKHLGMHSLIMDCKTNEEAHHRDDDGLNNQRYNLVKCTRKEHLGIDGRMKKVWSTRNKTPRWHKSGKSSHFFGVSRSVCRGKYIYWQANKRLNNKAVYIGNFSDEISAAKAVDKFCLENYGYAPNFPSSHGNST